MLRKAFVFLLLNLGCLLYGQQLTRFAVVDLSEVYKAFIQESRAVRAWEAESAKVQNEVDKQTREIQNIRVKIAEAVFENNQQEANRLELRLHQMIENLRVYYESKTAILQDQRARLMQDRSFLNQVHDEIRYIAESEGYTMVMNIKDPNIVWYSNSIDITDKLIQNLLTKARN